MCVGSEWRWCVYGLALLEKKRKKMRKVKMENK
jgi:hypothetical protein